MATLTVTDNADGTGAVATVGGSSGGSNTVYVQPAESDAPAWSVGGTRTGDGAVPLSLAKGYYFAYLLTAPSTLSPVARFAVTDGLDSVQSRCVAAVTARIKLLSLPCTARVYDSRFADASTRLFPCIVLDAATRPETYESVLNGRDDLGHVVTLMIQDVAPKFDDRRLELYRGWRQAVFRALNNQRLPGVPESVVTRVSGGAVTGSSSTRPQIFSELTVNCITREPRGLGA